MTQQQAEFEIKNLQQALTEWRMSNKAPVPIPAEVWSGAVRVAAVMGVGPVARELRVDYAKLKKLVVGDNGPGRVRCGTAATFLEVSTRGSDRAISCRLEVASREGVVLKAHLESVAPAEVGAMLREFVR